MFYFFLGGLFAKWWYLTSCMCIVWLIFFALLIISSISYSNWFRIMALLKGLDILVIICAKTHTSSTALVWSVNRPNTVSSSRSCCSAYYNARYNATHILWTLIDKMIVLYNMMSSYYNDIHTCAYSEKDSYLVHCLGVIRKQAKHGIK